MLFEQDVGHLKGTENDPLRKKIDEIIVSYNGDRSALISVLQEVQAEYKWLPQEALTYIAQRQGIPLIDLFSIVTFYKSFRLKPRGKHLITVCMGTACHVRGAPRVLKEFQKKLDIEVDETTEDNLFTLETVRCLGCCALGPIVVVDGEYHGQMTTIGVDALISELRESERAKVNE